MTFCLIVFRLFSLLSIDNRLFKTPVIEAVITTIKPNQQTKQTDSKTLVILILFFCIVLSCGFEKDFCKMVQSKNDEFDWTRQEGKTPSTDTGPEKANEGKFYVYVEATERPPGANAVYVYH